MAVTIGVEAFSAAIGVDAETGSRLLEVATELVDRYAPAAPNAVSNEAAIRTAGWLAEAPAAGQTGETVGDVGTRYAATSQSALRHSGAMALLTIWKVRRGGTISDRCNGLGAICPVAGNLLI